VGEGRGEGVTQGRSHSDALLQAARVGRAEQTDAERLLWARLRNRRLENAKFRRQHPLGRYILDFYCHAARLVVEVDGSHHSGRDQAEYDKERTAWLQGEGLKVIRFTNREVLSEIEGVLQRIRAELPSPWPSPPGRGRAEA
jgi:very-short-patch-repair endonuclease